MGIGSCLAGNAVRYNGQANSPNQYVRSICAQFEMRSFCPEMGVGMGVPRPPIYLVGGNRSVRVLDVQTHCNDYTEQLGNYANTVLSLAPQLCAYILVKGSPSCGYEHVKRHSDNGDHLASDQQGIFARALAASDPLLPLEDDERLQDSTLRESFITRAYAYHDWKLLRGEGIRTGQLIEFYSHYKDRFIAQREADCAVLEHMLATAGKRPGEVLATGFITTLMAALGHRAPR